MKDLEGEEQPLFEKELLATEEDLIEEEAIAGEEVEEILEEKSKDQIFEDLLRGTGTQPMGTPEGLRLEEAKSRKLRAEEATQDHLREMEPPMFFEEERLPAEEPGRGVGTAPSVAGIINKDLETVLEKGVQNMVADFITKILPDMTQNIIGLTAERIEKMVREVVPDLAEKAIREEIKRLQKEDKD